MEHTVLHAQSLSKTVAAPHGEGADLVLLDSASLSVAAGEAVAIIGPSGAGKSTLLGLLAGLDTPTSGDVEMFGQSVAALDEDGRAALRRGRVGFVFQNFQLLPGLSARENVLLTLELAGADNRQENASKALAAVGLAERAEHIPAQLSGGEQQRVALARAFAIEPQLLFADEPTGNLDQATGEAIADQLFALRDQSGSALVLVTHDNTLAARCDRRLVMRGGRLDVSD
ncbi:MAG: ABC transporter ATP-binding protein [Pseudomonadota bacterium]